MAKAKRRRRRGGKRSRTRRLLLIAVLTVIVAGFLTRRMLVPRAHYLLTHRIPPRTTAQDNGPSAARAPHPADTPLEELTNSDRHRLNDLINRKNR